MVKADFMEYLKYLEKTIDAKIPTDKETIQAWYEPFHFLHLDIAKKMARIYLQKESGYFKLSKLLEYKSLALAGVTFPEPKAGGCPTCDGIGFVQIQLPLKTAGAYPYITCRRCYCSTGRKMPEYIKMVTQEQISKMTKQYNWIWT